MACDEARDRRESEEGRRFVGETAPTECDLVVDVDRGLVVFEPLGELTAVRIKSLLIRMLEHPDFVPGMPGLWDLRRSGLSRLTSSEIRTLAVFNATQADRRGVARVAVVTSSPSSYGVARMYGVLGDRPHLEFSTFSELGEAEEWVLGRAEESG